MAYFTGGSSAFSANGTSGGGMTLTDASFVVPGATVYVSATGLETLECVVVSVVGTTVLVRRKMTVAANFGVDLSTYTTALSAALSQPAQHVWDSFAVAGGVSANAAAAGASAVAADTAVAQIYGKPVPGKSFNIVFDGTDQTQALEGGVVYVLTSTQDCFVAFDGLATSATNRDFVPAASPYVVSTPAAGSVLHVTQVVAGGTLYGAQRQKVA